MYLQTTIANIEITKESKENLLKIINDFRKLVSYKIKNVKVNAFLHSSDEQLEIEHFTIIMKAKHLTVKLIKYVQGLKAKHWEKFLKEEQINGDKYCPWLKDLKL